MTLANILTTDPILVTGHELVHRHRDVVQQCDEAALERWLRDAQESCLPSFRSLSVGIIAD